MSRYFFHVTDGDRLEIDRDGTQIPASTAVEAVAAGRACAAMERLGPTLDWSDWIVAVYDEIGNQHCVIAFSDAQALAPPQITGPECARRRQTVRKAGRTGRGLAKPNAGRRVSAGRQPRAS